MLHCKRITAAFLCGLFTVVYVMTVCGLIGAPDALKRSATYQGGWEESDGRQNDPYLVWSVPEWNNAGKGQTRLLYKDHLAVHGEPYTPRQQGKSPSCVGQAVAAAVDFLAAVEIRAGEPERKPSAPAAACVIYGLSRVEIGNLDEASWGGSHNLWGVRAVKEYGVVARLNYALLGYDLRQPDPSRCILFGAKGVPTGLEMIARIHPVKDYISIDSYEECRDALYMGCPVVIGSSQGFGEGKRTRDKEGFLNPPRRRFWKSVWNHSMVVIGVCDEGRRGVLFLNSWGSNWINGPQRFEDEPVGSFWVDSEIVDRMVKQGDSFAIRGFQGYLHYQLWRPK